MLYCRHTKLQFLLAQALFDKMTKNIYTDTRGKNDRLWRKRN